MKTKYTFKTFSMSDTVKIMNCFVYRATLFNYNNYNTIEVMMSEQEYMYFDKWLQHESIRVDRIE